MSYEDYEILYESERNEDNIPLAIVEYDPTSNKPFMVYELTPGENEYHGYSGEDTLEKAISVADELANFWR